MRSLQLLFLGLIVFATGCGPTVPPLPSPAGTVQFRFSVASMVKMSPNLRDPLQGTIYGNVFLQEDVGFDGPRQGAPELGDVEVVVDLRSVETSEEVFTSEKLPPGKYVFLGFFDVDGNGAESKDPDAGDPVTLPSTNKFEIVDGVESKRAVLFELLYN